VAYGENVLIVEDEDEWRRIYQRAVGAEGSGPTVSVATDLASAERLIDATKFAVAFVDVGLDVSDDQNIDGLRVMEKIRATGDETSIVVVTGRSGQDVLSITRDAIKKHQAYDTVGKSSVVPADIRRLLEGGLKEYRKAAQAGRKDAHEALRGDADPMGWDYQIMRTTNFKGNASDFYEFLNRLLGEYLPIVTRHAGGQVDVDIDSSSGLVHGGYWSRAIGSAIAICFGAAKQFDEAIEATHAGADLLGKYNVGDPVKVLGRHNVKGAIFLLPDGRREDFAEKLSK
jgi:CheY-like chemotaxis protein